MEFSEHPSQSAGALWNFPNTRRNLQGHFGIFQTPAATCKGTPEFSKHPPQSAGALRNFPNTRRNCASHSELSNHPLQAVSEYWFPQTYYPKKQKVRWHPIGFQRTFLEKTRFRPRGLLVTRTLSESLCVHIVIYSCNSFSRDAAHHVSTVS